MLSEQENTGVLRLNRVEGLPTGMNPRCLGISTITDAFLLCHLDRYPELALAQVPEREAPFLSYVPVASVPMSLRQSSPHTQNSCGKREQPSYGIMDCPITKEFLGCFTLR